MIMNAEQAVFKAKKQFEGMLELVRQSAAEERSIAAVEQALLDRLLGLGRSLLTSFVERQGTGNLGPALAERVRMFRWRTVEELYDLQNDPHCLANLANDPGHAADVEALRNQLREQMKISGDPLLASFDMRADPPRMSGAMWDAYAPYAKVDNRTGAPPKGKRSAEE